MASPLSGFSYRWFLLGALCLFCGVYVIWTTFFVDYFPKSKSQTVVLLANRGGLRQPTSMVELSRQMTRLDKYIIANENSSTCSDRIGLERILKYRNSFRQHAQAFCRGGSSSVQCDATIGDKNISSDYICVGENLHMNMVDLGNRTEDDRLRLNGDCSITDEFGSVKFMKVNDDPNKQMMDFKGVPGATPARCDRTIENAVILRIRETVGRNPWHTHEELITLFMTFAAMEIDPASTTLIINRPRADPKEAYPLLDIHEGLFGNQTVFADQVAAANDTVCLKRVVIPIPIQQAFYVGHFLEGCGASSIIRGYRDFLKDAYNVKSRESSKGEFRVTMVSRATKFKRHFSNEDEVVKALYGDGRQVRVKVFSEMPLEEQFDVVANTDLLVGAHGAGLFWLMLLPHCGRVLELGTGADFHYQRLAKYSAIDHDFTRQRTYHQAPYVEVDISQFKEDLRTAEVEWKKCSQQLPT